MKSRLSRNTRPGPEGLPKQCWCVQFQLKCPRLVPPAVQLAITDSNPLPALKGRMKRLRLFHQRQLAQARNAKHRTQLRSIFMAAAWNAGFKNISGDDLWLLTSTPGVTHSSMSNLPGRRKWVLTKSVDVNGKPLCWCMPVEVRRGRIVRVTLRKGNTFDLLRTYRTAMSRPRGVND